MFDHNTGAYVMMKDPKWIPAVENFLGATCFSTFCADNGEDAKVLTKIMEEVFLNERTPQIVYSKFFSKVSPVNVTKHIKKSNIDYNDIKLFSDS